MSSRGYRTRMTANVAANRFYADLERFEAADERWQHAVDAVRAALQAVRDAIAAREFDRRSHRAAKAAFKRGEISATELAAIARKASRSEENQRDSMVCLSTAESAVRKLSSARSDSRGAISESLGLYRELANRPKRLSKRDLRVGDRVRFLGYKTALSWGKRQPQEYGFIESIDGAYIHVRPRWWKRGEIIERYPNEIELACE